VLSKAFDGATNPLRKKLSMSKDLRVQVGPFPKDLLAPDVPQSLTLAVSANVPLRRIRLVAADGVVKAPAFEASH
jgi:hypothetical protein